MSQMIKHKLDTKYNIHDYSMLVFLGVDSLPQAVPNLNIHVPNFSHFTTMCGICKINVMCASYF